METTTFFTGTVFPTSRLISWESLSCQGRQPYGRSRGVTIHGDNGTVMIDRDGFWVYDPADKQIEEHRIGSGSSTQDLLSRDAGTNNHFQNLAAAIRQGTPQNSPIATI
ncbi:MAG: VCBS domain-containing protein, partial [Desulfobacterota bacterium]|nr:VCBS domain-containing protein [Thermodesulfobacteriota bacterium]